jgi:transposase
MRKNKYLSVGIDVSADFSFMSVVDPDGDPLGKPFKIIHNDCDSLRLAVSLIRKAEETHSMKSRTFLESTGIYHIPLFCFLVEAGLETFVLNPIISDSNRNKSVRKVKNDKADSLALARLGLDPKLNVSLLPEKLVMEVRTLVRRCYMLSDERAAHVNRLKGDLHVVFPGFLDVFSDVTGKAAVMLLTRYPRPKDILGANRAKLVADIAKASRRKSEFAEKKHGKLVAAAESALCFGCQLDSVYYSVASGLSLIAKLDDSIAEALGLIRKLVTDNADEPFMKQIALVDSIYGIGFLSAVTVMCEIGDFGAFRNPRQLFAYFGMDPEARQSGKFTATGVHMSKRGSRFARRAIFAAALACTRKKRNGDALNPFLHEYYQKKAASKPKKVAIGAVMHKISNIIFAVLRDGKPFELRSPEQQRREHESVRALPAA